MSTTETPDISPQLSEEVENEFHSPLDYIERSSQRKTVALFGQGLTIIGLVVVVVVLALRGRPAYVVFAAADGQEYVVSTPKKKIDLRDALITKQVIQDLWEFSEAYFEQSPVTAQRDYEKARWFLPDNMLQLYEATALGPKGWIVGLQNHTVQESHSTIDAIEPRAADLLHEPYQARVYMTRTYPDGKKIHMIANLTFIVRPELAGECGGPLTNRPTCLSRIPLYNALGVFIVKPIEETLDFRYGSK